MPKESTIVAPFRNWSVTFKITAVFIGIIMAIFMVAAIVLGFKWHNLLQKGMVSLGQLMSAKASSELTCIIDRAEGTSAGLANQRRFEKAALDRNAITACGSIIERNRNTLLDENEVISGIAMATETGISPETGSGHFYYMGKKEEAVIFKNIDNENYINENWFAKARDSMKPFWFPPSILTPYSSESCLYITPIHNIRTGKFLGALILEISVENLQWEIDNIPLDENIACYLFDSDGILVAGSKRENTNGAPDVSQYRIKPGQIRSDGKEYFHISTSGNTNDDGANIFYSHCWNNWTISLVMPGDWVRTRLFTLAKYLGGILLLTMPVIFALSFILTKRITGPLSRLSEAAEAIGSGHFNVELPRHKGNDEIAQLTSSFEQMQRELSVYLHELKKSFRQRESMESEINIAKTIQFGILPKIESAFVDADMFRFDLGAILIPAKGVGGDLYDFFYIDENKLALIVGDVSGKGIPAALFMSVTQTLQRSIAFRYKEPGEITTQLNKFLMMNNEASMFVTYFIGIIDICTGYMQYCNAGHNTPLIRTGAGDLKVIGEQHGPPLGVLSSSYASSEITLKPDDTLILYTDGITEAFNPHNELFGEIRLKEAVSYSFSPDPQKIMGTILNHLEIFVEGFAQSDDITLLVLQLKSTECPPPAEPELEGESSGLP